jgi:hypothetical protein
MDRHVRRLQPREESYGSGQPAQALQLYGETELAGAIEGDLDEVNQKEDVGRRRNLFRHGHQHRSHRLDPLLLRYLSRSTMERSMDERFPWAGPALFIVVLAAVLVFFWWFL